MSHQKNPVIIVIQCEIPSSDITSPSFCNSMENKLTMLFSIPKAHWPFCISQTITPSKLKDFHHANP